jgi:phosphatidylserine/phosphatidylglycerophosphate/cardiolipin synthase-like enzyme
MPFDEIGQRIDRLIVSPPERRAAVLDLMRSADHSLLLSMFRCDDFTVVDELAAAVRRGVRVRVLITQRARGWKEKLKDLTALLKSLGADVQPYGNLRMKYHAKYIIKDDGPALVTTLNFTRKCFEDTCDFLVLSEDPAIVASLKYLFEKDCTEPTAAALPPFTERLIVGPDHSRQRLTEMLSNAASSIRIIDHRVTDPIILDLLAEKRRQGVTVQVVGAGPMGGLVCHGRMILLDEKIAIIGSIHLSPPSLDSRREVAIVIEEPGLVAQLYDYFQQLAIDELNLINLWAAPPPISPQQEEDDEEDE